jgi:RNA polymerase sigma-70 factor (ECF subfamily)
METNNEARFDALYREHAVDVLGYCARRTSSEDAKDAASQVFVVALRKIDTVPLGEGALPWLYSVAKNVLRNRARSTRRRGRLALKLEGAGDETVEGPEPQVVRHSEHERLIRALEKLSSKDQEILRLVEWEGLSRETVAELFFVSRAAIDQRISRTYKRLARTLDVPNNTHTAPVPIGEGGEA